MDERELKQSGRNDEQDWLRQLQWLADMGRQVSETYAEHLTRVTQDADRSKALLQAHYRALHSAAAATTTTRPPGTE